MLAYMTSLTKARFRTRVEVGVEDEIHATWRKMMAWNIVVGWTRRYDRWGAVKEERGHVATPERFPLKRWPVAVR